MRYKGFTMFLVLAVVFLFTAIGCASVPFPQCNADKPPGAMLTQIADKHSVCLDDIGTALIVANGVNISVAKVYTASQALAAVDAWNEALEKPISDLVLQKLVYEKIGAFPEIFLITDVFKADFGTGKIIDTESRAMLTSYLRDRVRPMLLARVKAG